MPSDKPTYTGGEIGTGTTPIFLKKTFDMISSCDSSIASWFDNGTTFVVKDITKFAAEVIPAYFKHSNFSSFVRQLNFYGFRKIKSSSLRINDDLLSAENKYSKFIHENFQKGRPDLVAEIRKSNSETEGNQQQEVEKLRSEVKYLNAALAKMNENIDHLMRLVQTLTGTQSAMSDLHQGMQKQKRKDAASYPLSVTSEASLLSRVSVAGLPRPHRYAPMQLAGGNAVWFDENTGDAVIKKQKVHGEFTLIPPSPVTKNADWEPPRSSRRVVSLDDELMASFPTNGDRDDMPFFPEYD